MPREDRLMYNWKSGEDDNAAELRGDHDVPPSEKPRYDKKLYEKVLAAKGRLNFIRELEKYFRSRK